MTLITPLCVILQIRVVVSTIFTFQVFNHHRHLIREERYLAKQTLKASRSTNTDLQPETLDQTVLVTLNPDVSRKASYFVVRFGFFYS